MKKNVHTKKTSLEGHKGEWVAMKGKKVVACDEDPGKVMDIVKQKYADTETVILKVPGKNQILLL